MFGMLCVFMRGFSRFGVSIEYGYENRNKSFGKREKGFEVRKALLFLLFFTVFFFFERAQIMKLKMGNVPLNVRNAKTELLGYQEKVAELTKKVEELQKELISQTSLRDRMVSSLENELRRERESRSSLRMRLLKSPQEDSFDEGEAKVDFRLYRATVNDLSDALLFKILFNLGSVELILSTQYVCRRWQKIAWRIFTQQVRKLRRNGMQARGILDKLRDMFKK